MHWMFLPFKRYFDFQGRSRRMEFWMFSLLNLILAAVLFGPFYFNVLWASMSGSIDSYSSDAAAMESAFSTGGITPILAGLYGIYALIAFIPSIAVSVRRLHDRNMTGWWYLGFIILSLIPLLGLLATIAFIVIMALPGTEGANKFGPDPKGEVTADTFA